MITKVLMQVWQHTGACHTNSQTVDANAATHCNMPHKLLMQILKHAAVCHTNCWFKCCNTLVYATQAVDSNAATCCSTPHKPLMQILKHAAARHTNCWCKCCNMLVYATQTVDSNAATHCCMPHTVCDPYCTCTHGSTHNYPWEPIPIPVQISTCSHGYRYGLDPKTCGFTHVLAYLQQALWLCLYFWPI